jgi:hypothetical protein
MKNKGYLSFLKRFDSNVNDYFRLTLSLTVIVCLVGSLLHEWKFAATLSIQLVLCSRDIV